MEVILTVSVAIIAVGTIGLTVAGVAVLLRVRRLVQELERLAETTRLHLPALMHDVTQISADVRSIVRNVEREMPRLHDAVSAIRETARDIHDFERLLRQRIERPLLEVSGLLGSLLGGIYKISSKLLRRSRS
ncbi:MAG: DUF948 domain-containing protein [candidate division KSB1 bacterium]|nr:DUF948 domain-containing protein [candidate division KSB1 bacterium]MDZ7273039.1 DUF948 domain-containing protein [candidate division KSB1 bacterium]MDZ7285142.1 DUF948 domain-containing protein [candidate division KSB1 bacterium]MDZ7298174.1 DUF948 domain-containing protein [candidate division KSB1 bacterium]MDZ7307840.1 DUF948 domain-containing protein [candidate division KSB1 bacterium]